MASRTYAVILSLVGILLFLAVAGANVIVDPQFVFATKLITRSDSGNERLERFRAYEEAPDRYDGLVFGSSRARVLPLDELSKELNGATFATFAVNYGLLTDHIPVLEYILRRQTSKNGKLRAVFLQLDIDYFGTPPLTNQFNSTMLPPALMGESEMHFLWRHLTAIQFKTWRYRIREALSGAGQPVQAPPQYCYIAEHNECATEPAKAPAETPLPIQPAPKTEPAPKAELAPKAEPAPQIELLRITERADFRQQLKLLEQFVTLCRANGIRLVVAISPLPPAAERQFDPNDLDDAIDRVDEIVPVWDFSHASDWPSDQTDLWIDANHFNEQVAQMMLLRIFDKDMPPGWSKFGRRADRRSNLRSN